MLHDPTKKYHCDVFDTLLLKKTKTKKILQKGERSYKNVKEEERKGEKKTLLHDYREHILPRRGSRAGFTPRKRRIDANFSKATSQAVLN